MAARQSNLKQWVNTIYHLGHFHVIYITNTQCWVKNVCSQSCQMPHLLLGFQLWGGIHTLDFSYADVKFSVFSHGSPSLK